ncbi:MAG: aspartyl/glutamyl-tRNA amidotransferase subunit A [Bacilli bacterium]|nr:aspartyl/glutamyl-tRNA amidotransferase subunit A [Bacilli bacterium]
MDYLDLPLLELHKALVNKEVTPFDLAKEALNRAHRDENNAFEYLCDEEALSFAKTLTEPEEDNVLWGIPYFAKDNFSTKDIPTCASSDILSGYVPVYDATVIELLRDKKAVLLGKTTLDELAMGGTGMTGHLGITYNPFDPSKERMVGGSSCGSAASVAASIVPFALGSDTGDSVRKPASLAGLVGFKPTWGRISRYGLFPFAPSLDHVAYFSRDVISSALILDVLAGRDEKDATSSFVPVEKYEENIGKPIKGMKVGIIKEVYDSLSNQATKKHFDSAIEALKNSGVEIKEISLGHDLMESLYATYFVISCAEATSNNANLDGIKFGPYRAGNSYEEVMNKARTQGFSELIKRRFVIGSYCLMKENQDELFLRAQKNRAKIVDEVNKALKEVDFLIAMAAPGIAPKFTQKSDKLSREYLIADNHLCIGNFAGLPSITIPLYLENDMPVGINFTGRAFEEKELFQIAAALEKETGLAGLSAKNKKEGNL